MSEDERAGSPWERAGSPWEIFGVILIFVALGFVLGILFSFVCDAKKSKSYEENKLQLTELVSQEKTTCSRGEHVWGCVAHCGYADIDILSRWEFKCSTCGLKYVRYKEDLCAAERDLIFKWCGVKVEILPKTDHEWKN